MPVTICTCMYQTSTVCRIRRGRPRDLCAETSGHGDFRHERPTDQKRLRGRYGSARTDCQRYLALSGRSRQLEISSGITC